MPYKQLEVQLEYQRAWMAKRRQTALDARGNVCEECGSSDRRLEFHHREPADKFTHRIWSRRWESINEELAKCSLLCSACHLEYTRPLLRAKALGQPRDAHGNFIRVPSVPRIGPTSAPSHGVSGSEVNAA